VWSGFTWLSMGTVGGLLWMRWRTFGFWRHGVSLVGEYGFWRCWKIAGPKREEATGDEQISERGVLQFALPAKLTIMVMNPRR
jgi:hypothetical protein